ncbi:glycosyltransferase family 4 protein [Crateriforma spongiae]|uniref:glycosyltransferase family 4 protein n=1 Tax=Crateriforma spongiae TaxID=2724528 RepID=UPI0014484465|nr:glycosyltransferase family 4 protein [Crateriforma spongiae]
MTQLLIFETHPIQYRAPVYQALFDLVGDRFEVIYASDFSVRGGYDSEFGKSVSWDVPLLDGYSNRVLSNDEPGGIQKYSGLSGKGVSETIQNARPGAILLHSFGYEYCVKAFAAARLRRIPVWIRMETQDESNNRSRLKALGRAAVYRGIYSQINRFFVIGNANRKHYLASGVPESKLRVARYCTPNPTADKSSSEKQVARDQSREKLQISHGKHVIGFSGKLIPKKNPDIILDAWSRLPAQLKEKTELLFVGSGELESELRQRAIESGIPAHFAGFINQSKLADYYLAMDLLVLPSRKMGETWGLVVNEALDCGCSVVTSDAVGCSQDFAGLERFRVFPVGDAGALSRSIIELAAFDRDFDWAAEQMASYSVAEAAKSIACEIETLDR